MTKQSGLAGILGLASAIKGLDTPAPGTKSLHIDASSGELHVSGYSAEEVDGVLTAYRKHQEAMIQMMEEIETRRASGDAVRYRPDTEGWPNDVPDDGDPFRPDVPDTYRPITPEDVMREHPGT